MTIPDTNRRHEGNIAAGLRRFLRDFLFFAGRKGIVAAVFVALGALLEGLSLVLIVPLLGIVIGSSLTSGRLEAAAAAFFHRFGIERPFAQLALLLGIFSALMILRAIVISIRDVAVAKLQAGFVEAQRANIVERLAAAQWHQVVRLRYARITQLMSGDIARIGAMAYLSLQVAISLAMLLAQCVLVFLLAPALASLVFVLLILAAVILVPAVRRTHLIGAAATHANLSLLNLTAQFLGGLKLAVSQNLQSGFVAEFRQSLRDLSRLQIDNVRHQTNRRLALSTLSALVAAGLVLAGFGLLQISPPTLITLLVVMTRMIGPVGQIQQGAQQIAHALPAYEAVKALERDLAAIPNEPSAPSGLAPLPEGPVVFQNVSFRHAPDGDGKAGDLAGNLADNLAGNLPRGVQGISLTIAPGEWVGITGPSGAGKTTFADLLVGLFPPQQGRIAVGGMALDGAALIAWRGCVSYISQDPFLFHDSVRRNLAWANPQASEADIWQALALAGADDFVRRMEQGLDTVVGERGTLVSGGERQRIALARALLRNPRLLVLDEATGAIDAAGERAILERLRAMTPRPTVVMIAHRAESIALCDRVLNFEAGRHISDRAAEHDQSRMMSQQ